MAPTPLIDHISAAVPIAATIRTILIVLMF
jgi:hypothetical protein